VAAQMAAAQAQLAEQASWFPAPGAPGVAAGA
jgi:hypothetical protein